MLYFYPGNAVFFMMGGWQRGILAKFGSGKEGVLLFEAPA
jgi:hypothetical protein